VSERTLVIGTRGSRLALAQAHAVEAALKALGHTVRVEEIHTAGDRNTEQPLAALGGEGVFVKEIETALLRGSVDVAVHSYKDLPTVQPQGLAVVAVPERADPRDFLVFRDSARGAAGAGTAPTLRRLPTGTILGTGSPRRIAQALQLRPDLAWKEMRGNVETRLRKWREGECDALILAAAGLERLGLNPDGAPIAPDDMLPAVGQGALAIEIRADDAAAGRAAAALDHPPSASAVAAERALLRRLGGGCRAPIAAFATLEGERLLLRAVVADGLGRQTLRGERRGDSRGAADLGVALAEDLLARGAAELLPRAPASGRP
jgi:hydroxymethylbilane synthase